MKKLLLILIFIIPGLSIMSNIHAVTNTSEYNEPYYTVQLSYAHTGAEFRLNDIPFYLENLSGQVDVEIPVGDKVIQGENVLSIIAAPPGVGGEGYLKTWGNDDARAEATLYVREKNESKSSREVLTHIKIYPALKPENAATGSMIISGQEPPTLDYTSKPRQFPDIKFENQIVISRVTHSLVTPFPVWDWQNGQRILNTEENYNTLLEAYRRQYKIHQDKNLSAMRESVKNVAVTHNIINYYNDIEKAYDLLNLEESWKSKEQELFKFIEGDLAIRQGMKLDIIANGKLARIVNDGDVQPVLFIIKSQRMKIKYRYNFYLNNEGDWIYIM